MVLEIQEGQDIAEHVDGIAGKLFPVHDVRVFTSKKDGRTQFHNVRIEGDKVTATNGQMAVCASLEGGPDTPVTVTPKAVASPNKIGEELLVVDGKLVRTDPTDLSVAYDLTEEQEFPNVTQVMPDYTNQKSVGRFTVNARMMAKAMFYSTKNPTAPIKLSAVSKTMHRMEITIMPVIHGQTPDEADAE